MKIVKLRLLIPLLYLIFTSCFNKNRIKEGIKDKPDLVKESYLDSLDLDLESQYKKGYLPGFALSIFTSERIIFQKGYGYANIANKKEMNIETVQGVASISKTLLAVCLMKAIEENKIDLDDSINEILPFKVVNPYYKNTRITIRQLATHTSSISDDGNYNKAYIFEEELDKEKFPKAWGKYIDIYNKNTSMSMEDYLEKVFKEGDEWETENNFINAKPGTKYEYSNIGVSLLAYCIQLSVGTNYMDYTRKWILERLEMKNSGWSLKEVDQENHITYYNENYNEVPSYYCITYPDGGLYTNVSDLTKFMQAMMKGYEGKSKILDEKSFKEMMRNQIPELETPTGIIWDMDNTCCIGHSGNDFGIATMMFFDPETGIGKILFTNVSIEKEEQEKEFYSIFGNMFKYDSEIKKVSR